MSSLGWRFWLSGVLFVGFVMIAARIMAPLQIQATDPNLQQRDGLQFHGQPFSGILVELYQNGNLYRETQFRNGQKDGYYRQFSLNGNLAEIGNYRDGKKDGLSQGYFFEGPRRFEFHYSQGLLEGAQRQWHLNGDIFREEVYHEGLLVDKKILFADGKVFTNFKLRDDRIYGLDGGALCMERKKEGTQ